MTSSTGPQHTHTRPKRPWTFGTPVRACTMHVRLSIFHHCHKMLLWLTLLFQTYTLCTTNIGEEVFICGLWAPLSVFQNSENMQSKLTWIGPLRITLKNSGRNCLHFTVPDIKMRLSTRTDFWLWNLINPPALTKIIGNKQRFMKQQSYYGAYLRRRGRVKIVVIWYPLWKYSTIYCSCHRKAIN